MRSHALPTLRLVALAGLAAAAPAFGQDSVATLPGLPGDALDPYRIASPSEQVNNYILELTPFTSSWGSRFALGPAAKASKTVTGSFFDQLIAAQTTSNRFAVRPYARAAYDRWSTPGQGVNAQTNSAPDSSIATAGRTGHQFALAFAEFGAGGDGALSTPDDENGLVSAIVNFQAVAPNRLYVSRVGAATNKAISSANGTSSFGVGAIDEAGVLHLLADGYGMTDPNRLSNRIAMRIATALRSPSAVNNVNIAGGGDLTGGVNAFPRVSATSMTTPAAISSLIPGGLNRPVVIGTDFAANYFFEQNAGSTLTTFAYLPGSAGSPRGSVSFIPQSFARVAAGGSDAGTAASLARTNSNTATRALQFWGVNFNGSVDSNLQVILPTVSGQVTDPIDGYNPTAFHGALSTHEFTNYASQASFRGGNGQVAMTVLPSGNLLAAALVGVGSGSAIPQAQDNYLAVVEIDAATGTPTWDIAAHTGSVTGAAGGLSKAILGDNGADGLPGTADAGEGDGIVDTTPIGRIARAAEAFPELGNGPSISSAAMDRAGNLYFLAATALNTTDGGLAYQTSLLKANRDTATGGYRLERLVSVGDVFQGRHTGLNYQVQYLGVADGDSVDSAAIWSGNAVQDSIPGVDAAAQPAGSPLALGALVFHAKIVYDFNNDGAFSDPSTAGSSTSQDQAYNVALVLMPSIPAGDINRDGFVTADDIFAFLNIWFGVVGQPAAGSIADADGNGVADADDIFFFLNEWFDSI